MDDLFGTPERPASKLEAAFWAEHRRRPLIYQLFCEFTAYAIARGRKNFGVSVIFERIRWETNIERGLDGFKVNNNHRAYYARLWMRDHPEHDGFFRTRELRAGPVSHALKNGNGK